MAWTSPRPPRWETPMYARDMDVFSKVAMGPNGCIVYTGYVTPEGYGQVADNRTTYRAHRLAYAQMVGPIPDGLQLDHLCRNRRCINPNHLEPVTARVNTLRGETRAARNLAKTHCPKGTPLIEGNIVKTKTSGRSCLICSRERNRAYMRNLRAQAKASISDGGGESYGS